MQRKGSRLVLATPTHDMKKENYLHVDAFCVGAVAGSGDWLVATLVDRINGGVRVKARALRGTPAFADVGAMKDGGRYRVGGLSGLDVDGLLANAPQWQAQLCPVLTVEPLA